MARKRSRSVRTEDVAKKSKSKKKQQREEEESESEMEVEERAAEDEETTRTKSALANLYTSQVGESTAEGSSQEVDVSVLDGKYLVEAKNEDMRFKRLKDITMALYTLRSRHRAGDDVPWKPSLPKTLLEKKYSNNQNKLVVTQVACCFIDMFRIAGGEFPFTSEDKNRSIIQLIVRVIRGFAILLTTKKPKTATKKKTDSKTKDTESEEAQQSASEEEEEESEDAEEEEEEAEQAILMTSAYYLLEALVDASKLEGASLFSEYAEDFFSVFVKLLKNANTNVVTDWMPFMTTIMVNLIERGASQSDDLVENVLQYIVLDKEKSSKHTYDFARAIVERSLESIIQPMSNYINGHLSKLRTAGTTSPARASKRASASPSKRRGGSVITPELRSINRIVFELSTISSTALLYIMPNISCNLKHENLEVRTKVVKLLSEMFSSSNSTLVVDYRQVFEELLERFHDIDATIRCTMCVFASNMALEHPTTLSVLEGHLLERMMDFDEKVRKAAVESACDIASARPNTVTTQLLAAVGDRCRDKKLPIRYGAVKRLASLFRELLTKHFRDRKKWTTNEIEKFGWIPKRLMLLHIEQDATEDFRVFIENTIANELLPQSPILSGSKATQKESATEEDVSGDDEPMTTDTTSDSLIRSHCLLETYSMLDKWGRDAFMKIITMQQSFHDEVVKYVAIRSQYVSNSDSQSEDSSNSSSDRAVKVQQLNLLVTRLVQQMPEPITGKDCWVQLTTVVKDANLFRELSTFLQLDIDARKRQQLKENILKRFSAEVSKPELKDYFESVLNRASLSIVAREQIEQSFHILQSLITADNNQVLLYQSTLEFLQRTCEIVPDLFVTSYSQIIAHLTDESDDQSEKRTGLVNACLKMLRSAGSKFSSVTKSHPKLKALREKLKRLCAAEGTPSQAKDTAFAIEALFGHKAAADHFILIIDDIIDGLPLDLQQTIDAESDRALALASKLSTLRVIAMKQPQIFAMNAGPIVNFVVDKLLTHPAEPNVESASWDKPSALTTCKVAGIKLLGAYIANMEVSKTLTTDADYEAEYQREQQREHCQRIIPILLNMLSEITSYITVQPQLQPPSTPAPVPTPATPATTPAPAPAPAEASTSTSASSMDVDENERESEEAKKRQQEQKRIFNKDASRAHLRLAAAKGLLRVVASTASSILVPELLFNISEKSAVFNCHTIAWVTLDPFVAVRKGLLKALFKGLKSFQLPLRFAAILLLLVADPDKDTAVNARAYYTYLVQYLRLFIARSQEGTSAAATTAESHFLHLSSPSAWKVYPEYILPFLVHLLAHHPNLEVESPNFVSFQSVLFAYFDETMKDADNVEFFLSMIYKLKQLHDVYSTTPNSKHTRMLCDMSSMVLHRCTERRKAATRLFPGNIHIPPLFIRPPLPPLESFSEMDADDELDAAAMDETIDDQIDRLEAAVRAEIKRVYLPGDFKVNERAARKLFTDQSHQQQQAIFANTPSVRKDTARRTPATPATARKTTQLTLTGSVAASGKKSKPRTVEAASAKKKSTTRTPAKKTPSKSPKKKSTTKATATPRSTLPRTAKRSIDFNEETDEEEENTSESESESSKKKKSTPKKSPKPSTSAAVSKKLDFSGDESESESASETEKRPSTKKSPKKKQAAEKTTTAVRSRKRRSLTSPTQQKKKAASAEDEEESAEEEPSQSFASSSAKRRKL